jgi:hypothetical protein
MRSQVHSQSNQLERNAMTANHKTEYSNDAFAEQFEEMHEPEVAIESAEYGA